MINNRAVAWKTWLQFVKLFNFVPGTSLALGGGKRYINIKQKHITLFDIKGRSVYGNFRARNTVAHNCHGKRINLAAKRKKPHGKKRKDSREKEKLHGEKKNLTAKKKAHGKTSSMPKGHFNSYFVCREVEVFLFALSLFLFVGSLFLFAVRLILLRWHLWATIVWLLVFLEKRSYPIYTRG